MTSPSCAPGCCQPVSACDRCPSGDADIFYIEPDAISNSFVFDRMLYFTNSFPLDINCVDLSTTMSDVCLGYDEPTMIARARGMCHELFKRGLELRRSPFIYSSDGTSYEFQLCRWQQVINQNCSCFIDLGGEGGGGFDYYDSLHPDSGRVVATLDGYSDPDWVVLTIQINFHDWCQENNGGNTATNLASTTTYRIANADFNCKCAMCFTFVSNVVTHGPSGPGPGGLDYCAPCQNWPDKLTVYPAGSTLECATYGYSYGYAQGWDCPQCCNTCYEAIVADIGFNGDCNDGSHRPSYSFPGATYNLGYRSRSRRLCMWSSAPLTIYGGPDYTIIPRVDVSYDIYNPTVATMIVYVTDGTTRGTAVYQCNDFSCDGTGLTFTRQDDCTWHNDGVFAGCTLPFTSDCTGWPTTITVNSGVACVGGATPGCNGDCKYRAVGTVVPGTYAWELQGGNTCECECSEPERDPVAGDINVDGICKSDNSAVCGAYTSTWVWCVFDGANTNPPLPAGLSCGAGTGQTVSQWFLYANCPTGCSTGAPAFDGTVHGETTTTICF